MKAEVRMDGARYRVVIVSADLVNETEVASGLSIDHALHVASQWDKPASPEATEDAIRTEWLAKVAGL
jgi:hypothetical protein